MTNATPAVRRRPHDRAPNGASRTAARRASREPPRGGMCKSAKRFDSRALPRSVARASVVPYDERTHAHGPRCARDARSRSRSDSGSNRRRSTCVGHGGIRRPGGADRRSRSRPRRALWRHAPCSCIDYDWGTAFASGECLVIRRAEALRVKARSDAAITHVDLPPRYSRSSTVKFRTVLKRFVLARAADSRECARSPPRVCDLYGPRRPCARGAWMPRLGRPLIAIPCRRDYRVIDGARHRRRCLAPLPDARRPRGACRIDGRGCTGPAIG